MAAEMLQPCVTRDVPGVIENGAHDLLASSRIIARDAVTSRCFTRVTLLLDGADGYYLHNVVTFAAEPGDVLFDELVPLDVSRASTLYDQWPERLGPFAEEVAAAGDGSPVATLHPQGTADANTDLTLHRRDRSAA